MSELRGVVVTHGRLGEALVEAAEEISGVAGGLVAISNRGVAPERLTSLVEEAVSAGPAVVFVDLGSGSCGFAASTAARTCSSSVAVVTGVSLPMLLDFLFHRDMAPGPLAERLVSNGRKQIHAVSRSKDDDGAGPLPD